MEKQEDLLQGQKELKVLTCEGIDVPEVLVQIPREAKDMIPWEAHTKEVSARGRMEDDHQAGHESNSSAEEAEPVCPRP